MVKKRNQGDLIKVFAPDDDIAWDEADPTLVVSVPATRPQRQQRSRRGPLLAALTAVAVVVGGAIAWSDDAPTNTTSSTTATIEIMPTTTRPLLDPTSSTSTHYLIGDPSLTAYAADIVTPPLSGQQVQVWTDGTAVGPIVIIELHPYSYEGFGIVGATRDVVDGVELARSPADCPNVSAPASGRCEMLVTEVAIDSASSATVRATRIDDTAVARIVHELRLVDGNLAQDFPLMTDLQLSLTFEDESLDQLIFGRVESTVRYLTAEGDLLTLQSAEGNPDHRLAGVRYLAPDAPSSFGRTYGELVGSTEAMVIWEQDGRLLSLVGAANAGRLNTLSRRVRAATAKEWTAMVYGLRPDFRIGDYATLAVGLTSGSELWRAGPQIAVRAGRDEFLWWWTVPGGDDFVGRTVASGVVGLRVHAETVVVPGATFVFVTHPNAGGTVTVRTADGTVYTARLRQPFPDQSPVYMTVVRVEDVGPVTVDIDGVAVDL